MALVGLTRKRGHNGKNSEDTHYMETKNTTKRPWAFKRKGFKQNVLEANIEAGTLFGHIDTYGNVNGTFSVMPTYYSYNKVIINKISLKICG